MQDGQAVFFRDIVCTFRTIKSAFLVLLVSCFFAEKE